MPARARRACQGHRAGGDLHAGSRRACDQQGAAPAEGERTGGGAFFEFRRDSRYSRQSRAGIAAWVRDQVPAARRQRERHRRAFLQRLSLADRRRFPRPADRAWQERPRCAEADAARCLPGRSPGGEGLPHRAEAGAGQLREPALLRRGYLQVHQCGGQGHLRALPVRAGGGRALPGRRAGGEGRAGLPAKGDRRAREAGAAALPADAAARAGRRQARRSVDRLARYATPRRARHHHHQQTRRGQTRPRRSACCSCRRPCRPASSRPTR